MSSRTSPARRRANRKSRDPFVRTIHEEDSVDLLEQTHKGPRTLTQQLGFIDESGEEANKGVPTNGMMGMAPRDARREYEDGLNMLVAVLIISVSAVYLIVTINPFPHLYEPEPPPPPPTLVESWTARVASFFRPPPGLGTVPVKLT